MWQLHQFPLCPFSRKLRLQMGEKSVAYELIRENPWEGNDAFLQLNPAGRTPVLHDPGRRVALCDSQAICEFLEETVERNPLLGGSAVARAEVRRLIALFDENFYTDVTQPLLHERMKKRLFLRQPPDSRVLRDTMRMAHGHLDYIDWLVDTRPWIGGATLSLADLACAAQISVADYLGGIDWKGHEQARGWYAVMKSRPSFRPLLSEKMEGLPPPPHYAKVDS
ncbi:glutathione S-transferase family protein [Qipengyuania marisflavi]|uniref:Glutathione S-transferase family protein n=1 Tax=Qipengyuania marisflavi TaxID=2486356 RepID=A0A5S3P019_9SPHN|nr:glutathione S-transferase family protein [Qipengyuania marisflavi]TMM45869.1 glutathione S-transferase family protein [Qipengyuania marisflavi]